ncbi:MAG: hypothetical protein Q7S96_03915 [bacterium]|nr:hypothetical protein [bacterium]
MYNTRQHVLELLGIVAVVTIIGTGVAGGARSLALRTRDAQRAGDVARIQQALALIAAETGSYPMAEALTCIAGDDAISRTLLDRGHLKASVADPTAPHVPMADPSPRHCYTYQSRDGSSYTLWYFTEADGATKTVDP